MVASPLNFSIKAFIQVATSIERIRFKQLRLRSCDAAFGTFSRLLSRTLWPGSVEANKFDMTKPEIFNSLHGKGMVLGRVTGRGRPSFKSFAHSQCSGKTGKTTCAVMPRNSALRLAPVMFVVTVQASLRNCALASQTWQRDLKVVSF